MKLIVGLGNIGKEYEETRHNIGFMVVDELAKRWSLTWKEEKNASVAEYFSSPKTILIKPKTYMNLSGIAVRFFMDYFKIDIEDIAIVQDDLDLPCGKIRIRRKGTSGGHNGLKSIMSHLKTTEFTRFKVGIGHPEHSEGNIIKHVLQRFSKEEEVLIKDSLKRTADAIEYWLNNDIDSTMNKFNG